MSSWKKVPYIAIAAMAFSIFLGSYVSWAFPFPSIWGFFIGATFSVVASVLSLFAVKNKLLKRVEVELAETIKIPEGVHVMLRDKNGNVVKEIRIPAQEKSL